MRKKKWGEAGRRRTQGRTRYATHNSHAHRPNKEKGRATYTKELRKKPTTTAPRLTTFAEKNSRDREKGKKLGDPDGGGEEAIKAKKLTRNEKP